MSSEIFGYVRVSAKDQNTDRQLKKMRELGIPERNIIEEHQSGKDFNRPKYIALRDTRLREGDLLYLDSLDRLGRDYDGILTEWRYITRKINADIVVLEHESLFDSRAYKKMGEIGKLLEDQLLAVLAYVADQERKKINQRQKEGIAAAHEKGVQFGRPKYEITPTFAKLYHEWKAGAVSSVSFMKQLGMKKNTFYRRVKEFEEQLMEG